VTARLSKLKLTGAFVTVDANPAWIPIEPAPCNDGSESVPEITGATGSTEPTGHTDPDTAVTPAPDTSKRTRNS